MLAGDWGRIGVVSTRVGVVEGQGLRKGLPERLER